MLVTSVIVECAPDGVERVLDEIARLPQVSVFGVERQRIVAVIEGEGTRAIGAVVESLGALPSVIGVYPVYSGGFGE